MLTRYNFGAARDPEMLHKIYNAEPVAPIIEISRRVYHIFDCDKVCSDTNFSTYMFNIGIKHVFPCINIRWVPREVLKTEYRKFSVVVCHLF